MENIEEIGYCLPKYCFMQEAAGCMMERSKPGQKQNLIHGANRAQR